MWVAGFEAARGATLLWVYSGHMGDSSFRRRSSFARIVSCCCWRRIVVDRTNVSLSDWLRGGPSLPRSPVPSEFERASQRRRAGSRDPPPGYSCCGTGRALGTGAVVVDILALLQSAVNEQPQRVHLTTHEQMLSLRAVRRVVRSYEHPLNGLEQVATDQRRCWPSYMDPSPHEVAAVDWILQKLVDRCQNQRLAETFARGERSRSMGHIEMTATVRPGRSDRESRW